LDAIDRAQEAIVEEYNEQNPDAPIREGSVELAQLRDMIAFGQSSIGQLSGYANGDAPPPTSFTLTPGRVANTPEDMEERARSSSNAIVEKLQEIADSAVEDKYL
jgi:hypothetical protein